MRWLRRRRLLREAEALEREARRLRQRLATLSPEDCWTGPMMHAARGQDMLLEARAKALREEAGRC